MLTNLRAQHRCCVWMATAFATTMLCTQTRADIKITKANGQPVPESAVKKTYNPSTGGWTIELLQLYAPNQDTVFEIHGNAGETLDSVISWVNGPPAGSPVIIRILGDSPGGILNAYNIFQFGTAETLLNKVNVTQDIGSILIEAVGDLVAGRDIIGPVVATTSDNAVRGVNTMHATRDILGDVDAENGRILLVWAERNIGGESDPIVIRAKHNVYHVMALDVFADIVTRANGGNGGLWAIVANHYSGTCETEKLIFNPWNGLDARIAI